MTEPSTSWIAILTLKGDSSTRGKNEAEPYILAQDEPTFIGRSSDCQITLQPKYSTASRYHAKLELVNLEGDSVWQVCDLETPNGTFVNHQKIKECQLLKSGDQITLGKPRGANFSFEWKEIEIKKINDIFRKKHSHDETFVPNLEDFANYDEKTNFFSQELAEDQVVEHKSNTVASDILPPNTNIRESRIISGPLSTRRNFLNSFSKGLIALLFLTGITFLIYRIPESFKSQRSQESAFQSYVDNISRLLLDKKLDSLSPYDPDARKARESANGQTLTTLKNLEGKGKGNLIRFLYGAKLINLQPQKLSEEWNSSGVLFSKELIQLLPQIIEQRKLVYLKNFTIDKASPASLPVILTSQTERSRDSATKRLEKCSVLSQLTKDDKKCAWLLTFKSQFAGQPFLTPVQLSGADLIGITLKDAPLSSINLEGAYLSFSECKQSFSSNFIENIFYRQPIYWFTKDQCRANLRSSSFQNARLFQAVLMGANLEDTKLDAADLRQADLRGANLRGVSWRNAKLNGACYLKDNWQHNFPKLGPSGKTFNPIEEGMIAVSSEESDLNNPQQFKECKDMKSRG